MAPRVPDTLTNVERLQFANVTIDLTKNTPPVITSNGGGSSASVNVVENSTAVTTATATDANKGQALTFGIAGGADAELFTIDPATGALAFLSSSGFRSAGRHKRRQCL